MRLAPMGKYTYSCGEFSHLIITITTFFFIAVAIDKFYKVIIFHEYEKQRKSV